MTVSIILTIYNRPFFVSDVVSQSLLLPGNQFDECVVVLDTPIPSSEKGARSAYSRISGNTKFLKREGKPRWKCPSKAWNMGLKAATGDILYCVASDCIQYPGNIDRTKKLLGERPNSVIFGRVFDSIGAPYCSSTLCKPYGFIMAIPQWAIQETGGYDEVFMEGFSYEDHDFSWKLWDAGLDFVFDDGISGMHIAHDRDYMTCYEGIVLKRKNALISIEKFGAKNANEPVIWWEKEPMRVISKDGTTIWEHI